MNSENLGESFYYLAKLPFTGYVCRRILRVDKYHWITCQSFSSITNQLFSNKFRGVIESSVAE